MKDLHDHMKPAILGMLLLLAGVFFYLADRPPDRIYFIQQIGTHFSLFDNTPLLFGKLGKWLPTFLHVVAFSLFTAVLINHSRKGVAVVCAAWAGINIFMEFGQKYSDTAISLIPAWFNQIPVLKNTAPYFQRGTFDPLDLFAAAGGAVAAYILVYLTTKASLGSKECARAQV